jgi:hypothetical protein
LKSTPPKADCINCRSVIRLHAKRPLGEKLTPRGPWSEVVIFTDATSNDGVVGADWVLALGCCDPARTSPTTVVTNTNRTCWPVISYSFLLGLQHGALAARELRLLKRGGAHQAAHAHRLNRAARNQHERALFLEALVQHVHRPQVKGRWILLVRFRRFLKGVRDLHFRLTEDDPCLFLAGRLRLARHRVLQRAGDDHVAHLDRGHRDTPRIGSLVDQLLQFRFNPFTTTQQIRQRGATDDVAERGLRRPTHGLRVILHFQRGLLRVVNHPEQHGVDVHRHGV